MLIGLLPAEFLYERWHVTILRPDGAVTRCVVQTGGDERCGSNVPGDRYPHPTG